MFCICSLPKGQSSDDNSVESIIDANKSIGDSSDDACDLNQQKAISLSQPTQISIGTVSADQQYQTAHVQQQASNIILIRGARTENGQIILQNGHELLSLLNSGAVNITNGDDEKQASGASQTPSILLQNSRIKTAATVVNTTKQISNDPNKYVIQSGSLKNANQIIDASALGGNGIKNSATATNTVLLHSTKALKKGSAVSGTVAATSSAVNNTTTTTTTIPEGSIILQQRLNKNGTSDGPILLQTLKRLDKSQSILLFRNAQTTGTTNCTLTAAAAANSVGNQQITVVGNNKDDDKTDAKAKSKPISPNIPLGAGE